MGNFTRTYDPDVNNKKAFCVIAQEQAPPQLLDQPLHVSMRFVFSRPKSHFRTGKYADQLKDSAPNYHTSRGDVDNLAKFVFDALNGIYWRDDAIISSATIRKIYGDRPRTEVNVYTLDS
jgi:Holliday junction resolvase RusA-like endonuclease